MVVSGREPEGAFARFGQDSRALGRPGPYTEAAKPTCIGDTPEPPSGRSTLDIKIVCRACERTYPLSMAVDPENRPGHCPFCGEVLAFQYSGTFIDASERSLAIGREFVKALTSLAELTGGFAIEPDSVLVPVKDALAVQDRLIAEPYESRWPPRPAETIR